MEQAPAPVISSSLAQAGPRGQALPSVKLSDSPACLEEKLLGRFLQGAGEVAGVGGQAIA